MSEPTERMPLPPVPPSSYRPVASYPWPGPDGQPATGRYPLPEPAPPVRRRRRGWGALVVVVGLVVVAMAGWYLRPEDASSAPQVSAPTSAPVEAPRTFPTPGHEESDEPLGTPPAAPDSDVYTFVERQVDGVTPVAYDPCRPIAVVVSPDGAPAGAAGLVPEALDRLSAATWRQLRYEGGTDEVPGGDRAAYQPGRYGDRWAPVLIGWRTPEQDAELAGDVAGLGGSASAAAEDGPEVFVTGSVTLDGPEYEQLLAGGDTDLARAILLHELGHVVGLGHVWDDGQLMAATTSGAVLDFADGDLAGLALLGAGACAPEL